MHPYLRNKHKAKSGSCSNHDRCAEQCSIAIDSSVQCVCSHNDDSRGNACDVDNSYNEFSVVQSLDLDFAD